jgi:hypothetical protein
MGDTGFGPNHLKDSNYKDLQNSENLSGAESGAVSSKSGGIDPDLQRIIAAWGKLPQPIRAAILTMLNNPNP